MAKYFLIGNEKCEDGLQLLLKKKPHNLFLSSDRGQNPLISYIQFTTVNRASKAAGFLHINSRTTVWQEIFAGQNFRGFCRFASDRENFFAKSLPAANQRKICPAKISHHIVNS